MDRYHREPRVVLPLRGVALLFSIIELGLTAYGVSIFDGSVSDGFVTYYYNFGALNFLLFCSLWSILLLIYLIVSLRMPHITHLFVTTALLFITMIFWFAGFVALAVFLGSTINGACSSGVGSCGVLDAATAFAAFLWVIFLIDTVFAALAAFGSRGGNSMRTGGTPMTAA